MGIRGIYAIILEVNDDSSGVVKLAHKSPGRPWVEWDEFACGDYLTTMTAAGWVGELHGLTLEFMERQTSFPG